MKTTERLIALSHVGSGIKTILLVLGFIHLLPVVEQRKLDTYLFGFEELENNLRCGTLVVFGSPLSQIEAGTRGGEFSDGLNVRSRETGFPLSRRSHSGLSLLIK